MCTWAVPANRGEALFLLPSLRDAQRRLDWLPRWVVGDLAYISLPNQRLIREQFGVSVITRMRKDMNFEQPYNHLGQVCCPQGQRLQWLHYDAESKAQWFGARPPQELCLHCWEQSRCPKEFSFPAEQHEILLGQVPYDSWLARHLSRSVRPWVEPAQSYEKNQLGLSDFFLNSLQITWVMCLLADMVVLLRAHALLCSPATRDPLGDLSPQQRLFSFDSSF